MQTINGFGETYWQQPYGDELSPCAGSPIRWSLTDKFKTNLSAQMWAHGYMKLVSKMDWKKGVYQ